MLQVHRFRLSILVMILCCFTAAFFPETSLAASRKGKSAKKPVVATPVRGYADDLAERTAILAKLKELVENGQGDHALPVLNSRLAKNPDDSDLLVLRSAVFLESGDDEAALADARRAATVAADNPDARAQLGALLARGGQLEAASKEFAAALALDPTQLRPRLNLALCLQMLNKPQAAGAEFDEAVRRSPKSPDALLGRARLKEQAGDRAGAIADYRAAAATLPEGLDGSIQEKITALLEEQKSLGDGTPLISGNHKAAGTGAAVAAIGKNQQAAVTISAPLARPVSVSGTGAFVPPPATVTPLAAIEVKPSPTSQVVRVDDRLTLTLPAGLVKKTEQLVIDRISKPGLPDDASLQFRSLDRLQISLGDQHELETPIRVEYAYDPAVLVKGFEPWEQLVAMRYDEARHRWFPIPVQAGDKPGTIMFHTDHLSLFEIALVLYVAGAVHEAVYVSTEAVLYHAYHTPHFCILYKRNEILGDGDVNDDGWRQAGGGTVADMKWLRSRMPDRLENGYHAKHPLWIQDLGYYLERAFASYSAAGFKFYAVKSPALPLPASYFVVKVDSFLVTKMTEAKGAFDAIRDRLAFNRKFLKTIPGMQGASAHELFHAAQNWSYGISEMMVQQKRFSWWLEACAEYASCRLAWNLDIMGSKEDVEAAPFVNPRLLDDCLPSTGDNSGAKYAEVEYDKAYLVDYLVQHGGISFADLHFGVARETLQGGLDPVKALQKLYASSGNQEFADLFSGFARHLLFSGNSPMGAATFPQSQADKILTVRFKTAAQPSPSLEHTFRLPGPYSARVVAIVPDMDKEAAARKHQIRVTVKNLSPGTRVEAFLLPANQPFAATPSSDRIFDGSASPAVFELGTSDALYILAINAAGTAEECRATVLVDAFELFAVPAAIQETSGKRVHEFKAIAYNLPSGVRNPWFRWYFPDAVDPIEFRCQPPFKSAVTSQLLHTFSTDGKFDVRVELRDGSGDNSPVIGGVTIPVAITGQVSLALDPPISVVEPGAACEYLVRVSNSPAKLRLRWNFGDGSEVMETSDPVTTHAYAAAGNYRIQVELVDAENAEVLTSCSGEARVEREDEPAADSGTSTDSEATSPAMQIDPAWLGTWENDLLNLCRTHEIRAFGKDEMQYEIICRQSKKMAMNEPYTLYGQIDHYGQMRIYGRGEDGSYEYVRYRYVMDKSGGFLEKYDDGTTGSGRFEKK